MVTDKLIHSLRLRKGERRSISDGTIPGLVLRACGPVKRTWYVIYRPRPKAKQLRRKLGRYPAMTIKDARRAALDILNAPPPNPKKEITVKALCDQFYEEYGKPRLRGADEIHRKLNRHVIPEWGRRRACEVTRSDARDLLKRIERQGARRLTRCWARRVFNWGIEQDLVENNPFEKLRDLEPQQSRDRVLTDDELRSIWVGADTMGYPFGPLVHLLILTAARRGEVLSASRDWVRGDHIEVPAAQYKSKRPFIMVLPEMAQEIVRGLPKLGLLLTTTGGTPVSGIGKWKDRLDTASQVSGWRLHDLRRTAATGMARMGVPPHIVEAALGHKLPGVAGVYNRYSYMKERREALEAWSGHIKTLLQTPANAP